MTFFLSVKIHEAGGNVKNVDIPEIVKQTQGKMKNSSNIAITFFHLLLANFRKRSMNIYARTSSQSMFPKCVVVQTNVARWKKICSRNDVC